MIDYGAVIVCRTTGSTYKFMDGQQIGLRQWVVDLENLHMVSDCGSIMY
jgi:hypothetical protein